MSNKQRSGDVEDVNVGDKIGYRIGANETTGVVKDIITEDTEVSGRTVHASEDNPRYLVENEKTGKESAVSGKTIERVIEGGESSGGGGSKQGGGKKGGSKAKAQKSQGKKAAAEEEEEGGEEEEEEGEE